MTVPEVVVDEDLADLVAGFLENRRADVHLLRDALAQGDWERIRRVAHGVKGSGCMYGFHRLSALGAALEAGASQDRGSVAGLIEDLDAYLAAVTWRSG